MDSSDEQSVFKDPEMHIQNYYYRQKLHVCIDFNVQKMHNIK